MKYLNVPGSKWRLARQCTITVMLLNSVYVLLPSRTNTKFELEPRYYLGFISILECHKKRNLLPK